MINYGKCPKCGEELYPMIEIDQMVGVFCDCGYFHQTHTVVGIPGEHYAMRIDDELNDEEYYNDLVEELDRDLFIASVKREEKGEEFDENDMPF